MRFCPRNSSGLSRRTTPRRRDGYFSSPTAIWRLPSRFSEVGKMGMVAFYAGLFIGILLGFLVSSLWAFSLAKPEGGALSDPPEEFSQ